MKVNVDAHIRNATTAGLGVAVRDHQGRLIVTATKHIHHAPPEWAEAQAVRYGLGVARRLGFRRVCVESDSLNVIKAISCPSNGRSPIYSVYEDISVDRAYFDACTFSHTKRNGNTLAHFVARCNVGDGLETIRFPPFSESVETLVAL
ncbi:uncharacterized protein LOC110721114 [Chenopodium quinoa]|uniref:uncharacterized protein LOC110721114 n=1 Tax=Chenopodium quinoa TaxID=63459 RepID=UPI000B7703BD|nr:uncharacterized protein LOC110721114 [Chenopodium quinoa]